jgi:hypothetical protein
MVKIKETATPELTRNQVALAISARNGWGIGTISERLDERDAWDGATAAVAESRFDDAIALLDDTKKAT